MKINVVTVNSGWILQKIAERIVNNAPKEHEFFLSFTPRNDVDVNFYVDISNKFRKKSKVIDVGLFTHLHENSLKNLKSRWLKCDYIIHMCTRYYELFSQIYPKNKMCVLYPFDVAKTFQMKKPTIGIFQRGLYEGKGYNFLLSLVYETIIMKFKFIFVGKDWDKVVNELKQRNIDVEYYTSEDYGEYQNLYNKIDYLLIPSKWEGGPISMVEALSMGIPVISSDVGFASYDFKVDYLFEPGDKIRLLEIFSQILKPMEERRNQVEKINFRYFAEKLIEIGGQIKWEK